MDKQQSEQISAALARLINEKTPYIAYTEEELSAARESLTTAQIEGYRNIGLWSEDFEKFYVFKRFCDACGLTEAEPLYTARLFRFAQKLDPQVFLNDPYLKHIRFPHIQTGDFCFRSMTYERGEIFQYDMPDLDASVVVPKLGFFPANVSFPAVYEGNMPWMSVCPSEINSMRDCIPHAAGNVLVLGLGLGYFPYRILLLPQVKSVCIVEWKQSMIDIFKEYLLPQFPCADKVRFVCDDAVAFMNEVRPGQFDYCFADIWEGQVDGAEPYLKIRRHEQRLASTRFDYWIEKELRYFLQNTLEYHFC